MARAVFGTIRRPPGALDDLAVFVSVAQQASFVQASRRLAIPPSSVSRSVARLEEDLGVALLRRTSRKVALTDEGRQLLLHAAAHVEGLEEALATAADRHPEPSGLVRITAPAYSGSTRIARALATFAVAHPKITIELDATNAIRDLVQDGFDFGIRVGPHLNPDFVAKRLWRGEFGLFAARAFVKRALGGKARVSRAMLERLPCVVLRMSATWRFRSSTGELTEVSPRGRFSVNDPRGAVDVARQGVGIALVPLDAIQKHGRDLVALRADIGDPEPVDLFAVYPSRRLLPQRVRLALEWLSKPKNMGDENPRVRHTATRVG